MTWGLLIAARWALSALIVVSVLVEAAAGWTAAHLAWLQRRLTRAILKMGGHADGDAG